MKPHRIQCTRCHKQYIRDKKNDDSETYLTSTDGFKAKPFTAPEHFLSNSDHFNSDMQLISLETINTFRDSVRKGRESHLIYQVIHV